MLFFSNFISFLFKLFFSFLIIYIIKADTLSIASQTDLTWEEIFSVAASLSELTTLRLQYDESRRNVQVDINWCYSL